jgi:hypothetical protein
MAALMRERHSKNRMRIDRRLCWSFTFHHETIYHLDLTQSFGIIGGPGEMGKLISRSKRHPLDSDSCPKWTVTVSIKSESKKPETLDRPNAI